MAISENEQTSLKRQWLVIDNDCKSSTYKEVIDRYDTKIKARRYAQLFTVVRQETKEEFLNRCFGVTSVI